VSDPWWVLVTGSRFCAGFACILGTFREIAAAHPGQEIVLLQGMCDPRHPGRPKTAPPVPWRSAEKLSAEDRESLLGADWLSVQAALRLGWRVESRPAGWKRLGKGAGFARNDEMIAEMLANGAAEGNGECVPLWGPCESPGCRIAKRHNSHGTAHCVSRAARAGIPVRTMPGAIAVQ
jgi:hypothetical protein